jgi:hypothetical protein
MAMKASIRWKLHILRAISVLAALPCYAQTFSVGVKAGVPITEAYSAAYFSNGNSATYQDRYVIGPTAEIHLPFGLSFEADALYRGNGATAIGDVNGKSTVNDWQFPFLGKYELKRGAFRPFVDAGLVYRHLSGKAFYSLFYPYGSTSTLLTNGPNMAGLAVGGGVTVKVMKFRLSPEVRYTHWLSAAGDSIGPGVASVNSNQADLLVGFTF